MPLDVSWCYWKCKAEGGKFVVGRRRIDRPGYESGCYVKPCIAKPNLVTVLYSMKTFAPIYTCWNIKRLMECHGAIQNNVPGIIPPLLWPQYAGGGTIPICMPAVIVALRNVNIGTSGRDRGGAFGEKRKPAADVKAAVMPGRFICAVRPIPSTIVLLYRWGISIRFESRYTLFWGFNRQPKKKPK